MKPDFKEDKYIDDDQIRVIRTDVTPSPAPARGRRRLWGVVILAAGLLAFGICMAILYSRDESPVPDTDTVPATEETLPEPVDAAPAAGHVERTDTVSAGIRLMVLEPVAGTPVLTVGTEIMEDTTVILALQAADVRKDNGGIVGTYVCRGEVLGRGESKAGYCAIVDGKITLGAATATPLLEEVLADSGYFFRQYPLVVSGQPVANDQPRSSFRRALAVLDGKTVVIVSGDKATFAEFSRSLAELGVTDAIYLTGSTATGFYRDADGKAVHFGGTYKSRYENINFISW